jgi:hypothetical protein
MNHLNDCGLWIVDCGMFGWCYKSISEKRRFIPIKRMIVCLIGMFIALKQTIIRFRAMNIPAKQTIIPNI